jgi:predicted  nucleic acid-binding Zn-ribbon protein
MLGALAFALTSATGCKEHQRLEAETAAAKAQFQELRPKVQQLSDEAATYNKLRNASITKRNQIGYDAFTASSVNALEDEVDALQAEKTRLEKDLKAIEEEHQEYKKSNS